MRLHLALAAVALVAAVGPGWAGEARCMLHVHRGAAPYIQSGDLGPMIPAKGRDLRVEALNVDDGIDYLDTKTPDGPWVWSKHRFIYRLSDVKIYGDCTHMRVNELD